MLRLRSLACCALHCFSRGAGKGGRKGEVGPEKQLSEEAAAEARSGGVGGRRGGGLQGGRSCCRCHCYRRCHIGFLLYRQPLWSCDRSRAAVTTVRSRPRERARTCARPPPQRKSRLSGAVRHAPILPVSGCPRAHARDVELPRVWESAVWR